MSHRSSRKALEIVQLRQGLTIMLIMDDSPQVLAKLQLGDVGAALELGSER